MGQINTNNYPTVSSLADADLLIVENAVHGTGTTTPKQLRENAIGTDTLQTSAQTVTGAINELKDEIDTGANVYLGINMGKVVTVTSGVADTDIDLERMPKPGERILLVFEEERTSVTNIKTYLDGAGITIPIGTGEPSQKYLGQYVFECASGTQPESRLWNMVTKDYGVLPTPFATSVGGTGNTSGYIRTGREGSSTVGTAATIEGTHNEAGYANQTVMGVYNNNKADTLLEVGNGSSSARSNALEVFSDGHVKDGLGNDMEALSALEATASGNPIVVNAQDVAAKELSVEIEPIQDLHGYDHPWAGGAGKNKLPMTVAGIKAANSGATWSGNSCVLGNVTFTIQTDADNNVTGIKLNGTSNADWVQFYVAKNYTQKAGSYIVNGVTGGTDSTYRMEITGKTGTITNGNYNYTISEDISSACLITVRTSGTVLNNVVIKPMVRLSTVSDATFEPYSNICPISGRTEVNLGRGGFNVWDEQWVNGFYAYADGSFVSSPNEICSKNKIPVLDGVTYYFNCTAVTKSVRAYRADNSYYGALNVIDNKFTVPSDVVAITINMGTAYGTSYANNICVNVSDDAFNGKYVPYITPVTLTIALGQTVYGGTLDAKTGVLDDDGFKIDLGSLNWSKHSTVAAFFSGDIDDFAKVYTSGVLQFAEGVCDSYKYLQQTDVDGSITLYHNTTQNNDRVFIWDSTNYPNMTADQFKAYLSGKYLCYKLATPTTVQLTPAQLELLKGYNYITGDGIIDLVYVPESISGLMEEVLVPISMLGTNESSRTTASRAYVTKEYFYKDKKMYRVTANIAQGAAFTVNTNCVETTLFAELKAAQN